MAARAMHIVAFGAASPLGARVPPAPSLSACRCLLPHRSCCLQGAGSRVVATMAKKSGEWSLQCQDVCREAGAATAVLAPSPSRTPVSAALRRHPRPTSASLEHAAVQPMPVSSPSADCLGPQLSCLPP